MTTNTFTRTIARIALPVVSAALIGGAALGMAGIANAAPTITEPSGSGHSHGPLDRNHPAPTVPGHHHGRAHGEEPGHGYTP
jgi:hypothetical protein